jgi:hypothetical protein
VLFEIAWYACDGHRPLSELAALVEAETGRSEPEAIATFFNYTAELGLSEWA